MELIIKTAIADAALYLYCEHGVNSASLLDASREDILKAAAVEQINSAARKRDDQLHTVEIEIDQLTPDQRRDIVQGFSSVAVDTMTLSSPAFDEDIFVVGKPRIAELLIVGPSGETVASVGGFVSRMVAHEEHVKIPRTKLEALRDARDGKDGSELCDLMAAISDVLDYL